MKDEALRMSLEALERYVKEDEVVEGMPGNEPWVETKYMGKAAITAIKQALAAPAQGCNFCNHPLYAGTKCKNCGLESAQPAPAPEPVAWRYKQRFLKPHHNEWYYSEAFPELHATVSEPLYTTPPAAQRQWVGLTRAECLQIEKDMMKYYDYQHECKTVCLPEFARAIEAKLREKNAT